MRLGPQTCQEDVEAMVELGRAVMVGQLGGEPPWAREHGAPPAVSLGDLGTARLGFSDPPQK